jgi:hypothetical protein
MYSFRAVIEFIQVRKIAFVTVFLIFTILHRICGNINIIYLVALLRILYNFVILYFGFQEAEESGLWADGDPSYKRDEYHRLRTDLTSLARKHPDILQGLQQPYDEAYFLKLGSTGNYEDLQVCSRSNRTKDKLVRAKCVHCP